MYETRLPAGSAVDSILLGMASQPAEDVDTHFSKEMSVRLFSENPPTEPGLDLPAINTQRGRDHGIPGDKYLDKYVVNIYILYILTIKLLQCKQIDAGHFKNTKDQIHKRLHVMAATTRARNCTAAVRV